MIPKKLFEYQDKIKALNPQAQTIDYYIGTWRKHLGRNEHLEYLAKHYPKKISRADLFQLAAAAGSTYDVGDILKLFIGTMLWGYGTVGYGAWRTNQMLSTTNAERTLVKSFELARDNKIEDAYRNFNLRRCGPPFFTKFFYFIGYGCKLPRYPLILDTRVYEALKDTLKADISLYVKRSTWWYPKGYIRYIESMHEWAQALDVEAHNIELFLFELGE
jgi:hypothetical protein